MTRPAPRPVIDVRAGDEIRLEGAWLHVNAVTIDNPFVTLHLVGAITEARYLDDANVYTRAGS